MNSNQGAVLDVEGLRIHLETPRGLVQAVDGVSLTVGRGESVALVGESGCGKTMTALSIMRLIPSPPAKVLGGVVRLGDGSDVMAMSDEELRQRRGSAVGMMFQDPSAYLNPLVRIGDQVAESLRLHGRSDDPNAVDAVLSGVGLSSDSNVKRRYPHELSGGMKQRALLAVAVACRPDVLIADEPTTALDVTIQAQVLRLLRDMCEEGLGVLLITHDLSVVAEFCDRVYVMYAGRIVEEADVYSIFERPQHPYTQGLLAASRSLGGQAGSLHTIEGTVPDLRDPPPGCRFAPRCSRARGICESEPPYLESSHSSACRSLCWIGHPAYEVRPTVPRPQRGVIS